jgi:hypothetical protein
MKQEWYYTLDGERHGPVSGAELKRLAASGELQPTDKVRKEGMADWLPASQVKGLFPDLHEQVRGRAGAVGKTAETVSTVAKATGKVADAVSDVAKASEQVQKAVTTVAGIAAGGSTLVGSVGDFLRPLGPINLVVFAAALLSGGILFVLSKQKPKSRVKVRLKLGSVASLVVAAIFGLWTGLGAVAGKDDKGVLATNIKPVEQLQASVVAVRQPQPEPAKIEQPPAKAEEGWLPLFNGKNLAGWRVGPAEAKTWRVQDGILVGSGPAGMLYTTRGDFTNFHLRAEVRINDGGNSGLFFRTPASGKATEGYEADINSTHKNPAKTGTLRRNGDGAVTVREMLVPPGQWFAYEVIAEGNHITLKVDGKTTADFTDPQPLAAAGHIALQQHNPETLVEFRKIEVKEVTTPPPPSGTWVEERTEKAGARIREFRPDGTLILHMPKSGQTFKGTWKWGQGKVFLSEDGKAPVEDKWFTIVGSDERSMTILMMGTRRYVWTRTDPPLAVNPIVLVKTSLGDIRLELFADKAPKTVENFLAYVDEGFYDGTIFHRVVPNFTVQGGGFEPGLLEKKPTRPTMPSEADNGLSNTAGTVAMASPKNAPCS